MVRSTSSFPPPGASAPPRERALRLAPAAEPTNAELVRRLRDGDREAGGLLFDRHARTVRGVLRRALGPDQELEDLVHEVFVLLFSSPHTLREPEKIGSFLFGMAVRVASAELRRRRVRRRVVLTRDGEVPAVAVPPADGASGRAVLALYRILDELDARDRLVFVLRELEELTVTEVARHLGVSDPTVKRAAARAWRHVRSRAADEPCLVPYLDRAVPEEVP